MTNQLNSKISLNDLLKTKCSLEDLFEHTDFLDEVTYQNEQLYKLISTKENIKKMLDYIYTPELKGRSFAKVSHYAFFSYKVIADCEPKLTKIIIEDKNMIKKIFSLINDNKLDHITSRGYFQSILKNLLSDLNPHLIQFVKILKENAEHYIFPLVKNLNKANSEIIKDILCSTNEKLKKLQLCIFEFLLFYFLNEQFSFQNANEQFDNLIDVFKFIQTLDFVYNYKLKYEYTLYSDEYVKNNNNKQLIYSLKLVILNYIAATKQIKTCKNPEKFITSYKKYIKSHRIIFLLKDLLCFFESLSQNSEFGINEKFVLELLNILKTFPKKDVLHAIVFKIFDNQIDQINQKPKIILILAEFIVNNSSKWKTPQELHKNINFVSLHYIFNLISDLDLSKIKDKKIKESIQNQKDLLSTIFTKLCYSENDDDISDTVEVSEIIPVKDFFKKGSRIIPENDKRFHYEDDIKKAQPLDQYNIDVQQPHQVLDSDESDDNQNEVRNYQNLILSEQKNLDENLSYHFKNDENAEEQDMFKNRENNKDLLLSASIN